MAILIPVSAIDDNPFQTRLAYDEGYIAELASDIERNGLLQAPLGRLVNAGGKSLGLNAVTQSLYEATGTASLGSYRVQLAFGHNRVRAFRHAGTAEIPVELHPLSDEKMAELAWAENEQRRDLTPVEEARAIERMIEAFSWTHDQVAEKLGLARPTVSNKLRLLRLPSAALDALQDGRLSESRARALLPAFACEDEHPEIVAEHEGRQIGSFGRLLPLSALVERAIEAEAASSVSEDVEDWVILVEEEAERRRREREPEVFGEADASRHAAPAETDQPPASPEATRPASKPAWRQPRTHSEEHTAQEEQWSAEWRALEAAVFEVLRTIPAPARPLLENVVNLQEGVYPEPEMTKADNWAAVFTVSMMVELGYAWQHGEARQAAKAWGIEVEWPAPPEVSAETKPKAERKKEVQQLAADGFLVNKRERKLIEAVELAPRASVGHRVRSSDKGAAEALVARGLLRWLPNGNLGLPSGDGAAVEADVAAETEGVADVD